MSAKKALMFSLDFGINAKKQLQLRFLMSYGILTNVQFLLLP